MDNKTATPTYTAIPDYRLGTCGCCTGRSTEAKDGYGGYRLAVDQCVCWIHQDAPRGRPACKCSVHAKAAEIEARNERIYAHDLRRERTTRLGG